MIESGFAKWLNRAMARNGIHKDLLAERSGLHVNTIEMYLRGDHEPRPSNLIPVIAVISNIEDRSPTQIMFEAVTSFNEMKMVESRWRRKKKKTDSKSQP